MRPLKMQARKVYEFTVQRAVLALSSGAGATKKHSDDIPKVEIRKNSEKAV